MAIQVKESYRGRRTQEQLIAPGVYFREDPALHGLADFLIETGRAIEIVGEPTLQLPEPETPAVIDGEPVVIEPDGPETLEVVDGLDDTETIVDAPDDPLPFTEEVVSDDGDTAEVTINVELTAEAIQTAAQGITEAVSAGSKKGKK